MDIMKCCTKTYQEKNMVISVSALLNHEKKYGNKESGKEYIEVLPLIASGIFNLQWKVSSGDNV